MKTPLYDRHLTLDAKIVDFNGWEMPIHYPTGIIQEHLAVRNQCGLFDVSHMGRIEVTGPQAGLLLDYLSINIISSKADKTATYTAWCHTDGGTVDDLIVFKINSEHYFIVANASNREKDWAHLSTYASHYDAQITAPDPRMAILALQGPHSQRLLGKILPTLPKMLPMHLIELQGKEFEGVVSTTGYTGAGGYEILCDSDYGLKLWDKLLALGGDEGIKPIGLAARDTLRLEMGYALYGHELSDSIRPTESVSAWAYKPNNRNFLGKEALISLNTGKRRAYGVVLSEKSIPRQGFKVFKCEECIGEVTSGNYSPVLDLPIALILANRELSFQENIEIEIRNKRVHARVAKLPFIERGRDAV